MHFSAILLPLDHPGRYWDAATLEYLYSGHHALWRQQSDRVNLELLQAWLRDGHFDLLLKTDMFDEAVSEGLLRSLLRCSHRVIGMDISRLVLTSARSRYSEASFICADLRNLPLSSEFDCIVSNSSLDHFESPEEIYTSVAELYRILRPGGLLVLTLDNPQNPLVRLRNAMPAPWLKRLGLVPYHTGPTCNRRELIALAQRAGFEVLDTTAILHFPRILLSIFGSAFHSRTRLCRVLLDWALRFECLRDSRVCYFTGHFVAIKALKPAA